MGGRPLARLLALSLLTVLFSAPVAAQPYPSQRITLIVPYTPGSGFDIVARTVGQKLAERWGQAVVVDNKPGASGTLGTEIVANAAPDGYTMLVSGAPHTVYSSLLKTLRFDPLASFTPIGVVATGSVALTVNPDVLHVPYRGASVALTDFLTGQVHFTYLPVNTALPQVQSGKLRMLAVASSRRSPMAPEVPSLHELGHPTLDFDLWFGFLAPVNLPAAVLAKWEQALAAITALTDVRESFQKQGLTPVYLNSSQTAALIKSETARWREVAEKAGIKPE
jgi:tripartite-type tricarboxylate transporter receptor subunit TctC